MKGFVFLGLLLGSTGFAMAQHSSTGTWKVDGDVQGTPVKMTCVIEEKDQKLTGNCTATGDDPTARPLTGEVREKGLAWRFDSDYQGTAITVSFAANLNDDGSKMSGTMSVAPLGVDGTFTAVRQ